MDPQDNPQTPPSDLTPDNPTSPESSADSSAEDDPLAALDLGIAEATPIEAADDGDTLPTEAVEDELEGEEADDEAEGDEGETDE